jgi:hypothetical protein
MGFDDTWADASPEGGEDNAPPNGLHDAALIDAGAFTSKSGNDVARLEFQTVDKQHQWTSILGFGSSKQAGFSKAQCMKVGVDVDAVASLEELDAALKACTGGFYEVEVEHNGEYVNTYVRDGAQPNESDIPTPEMEPAPAGAEFGDDVPFS